MTNTLQKTRTKHTNTTRLMISKFLVFTSYIQADKRKW